MAERNTLDWYITWLHVRAISQRVQFDKDEGLLSQLHDVVQSQIADTKWNPVCELQTVKIEDEELTIASSTVPVDRKSRFAELLQGRLAAVNTSTDPLQLHDISQYEENERALWVEFMKENSILGAEVRKLTESLRRRRFNWDQVEYLSGVSNSDFDKTLLHLAFKIAQFLRNSGHGTLALDYLRRVMYSENKYESREATYMLTLEEGNANLKLKQLLAPFRWQQIQVETAFDHITNICNENPKAVTEQIVQRLYEEIDSEITRTSSKTKTSSKMSERAAKLKKVKEKLRSFFERFHVEYVTSN